MKSKTHNYKMEKVKTTGRIRRILLGIVAVAISNLATSNNSVNDKNSSAIIVSFNRVSIEKPVLHSDPCIILPCSETYKKSLQETIKENNLIIESQIVNEVYPLDFKKIYKAQAEHKKMTNQKSFAHKRLLKM